ncbi:uncharacterized protein ColSpa_02872 [Colletotrichum spaethianum]|uniref:Uncharacterized protein n=1 Tax=Colletotrichum spaethianum TaxID=700344 RepID=A0AA37L6I6_9PEZI|nr:uncharacterized protein ColSpa_02872 [Colletotrichum spaethianum]GKT42691.1 hypothetical protein ColSpa_02872 [Colletotrichum spaethianum]
MADSGRLWRQWQGTSMRPARLGQENCRPAGDKLQQTPWDWTQEPDRDQWTEGWEKGKNHQKTNDYNNRDHLNND